MEEKSNLEEIKNGIEIIEKKIEIPYIVNEIGFEQGCFDYKGVRYFSALRGIVYDIALTGNILIGNARLELYHNRYINKKRLMIVNGKLEFIHPELANLNFLIWSVNTRESESDVLIKDFCHTILFDKNKHDNLEPEKLNYKPCYKLDLEEVMIKRGINLEEELMELTFSPIDTKLKIVYHKLKGLNESVEQLKGCISDFEDFSTRD